jgi:hypothetical protein
MAGSIHSLRALVQRSRATSLLLLHDIPGDPAASRRHLEEARALVEPIRALAATDAETRDTISEVDAAWAKLSRR